MGKCMWLIHVERCPRPLTYTDTYKLFEDENSEQALAWAKEMGYDSVVPLDTGIGVRNSSWTIDTVVHVIRILVTP